VLAEEVFNGIEVHTDPNMKERVIGDASLFPIHYYFMILHIKSQVKMSGSELHAVDPSFFVEQRTATLAS
jgi:hypothetical protein